MQSSVVSDGEDTQEASQLLASTAGGVNMEDTAQLKAMAHVDIDRITRDRNDKL